MNKILIALAVLVGLLNPLTGDLVQAAVISGWNLAIVNVGWAVTVGFAGYLVFYLGWYFARLTLREKSAQNKKIAKVSKSKRKLDGLQYEM